MSQTDIALINKYRKMMGIGYLVGDGVSNSSMSVLYSLNIAGTQPTIINTMNINSSLYISGYSSIKNSTFLSSFNAFTNNSTFQNIKTTSISDQDNIICNTISSYGTLTSNLIKNTYLTILDTINIDNLISTNISVGSIIAPRLNFNGQLYIQGSTYSVFTSSLTILDSSIVLGSYNNYGVDLGYSSGINFYVSNGIGRLTTSGDAKQFICTIPNGPIQYLLGYDDNYNISITGNAYIGGNLSNASSIYCNSIRASGLNISNSVNANTSIINGTIQSILNVNKIISTRLTNNSNLSINSGIITSSITSNSITCNNIISSTISNTFYTCVSIFNNNAIYNTLNVINNITANSINSVNVNSSNINIQGYSTIKSIFCNNGFLNLQEYSSNSAAKNAGLPVWALYKTNGVVRIRLNDIPPQVALLGNTTVTTEGTYTDSGITVLSSLSPPVNILVDLVSDNYISDIPIDIVGTYMSFITATTYLLKYKAVDSEGNTTTGLSRLVNAIPYIAMPITMKSLNFTGESSNLSRTPSISGNNQRLTISIWFKVTSVSNISEMLCFGPANAGGAMSFCVVRSDLGKTAYISVGSAFILNFASPNNSVTPNVWTHAVIVFNTTLTNPVDRIKLWINGVPQVNDILNSTYRRAYIMEPTDALTGANITAIENSNTLNSFNIAGGFVGYGFTVGNLPNLTQRFTKGKLAQVYFIEGQSLNHLSFGRFRNINDIPTWEAISYAGTFSGNSFYLPFTDPTNIGKDYSGIGNDFQINGLNNSNISNDLPPGGI